MARGDIRWPEEKAARAEELLEEGVKYLGYWRLRRRKRSNWSRVPRTTIIVSAVQCASMTKSILTTGVNFIREVRPVLNGGWGTRPECTPKCSTLFPLIKPGQIHVLRKSSILKQIFKLRVIDVVLISSTKKDQKVVMPIYVGC
jgi:hypothetical protein